MIATIVDVSHAGTAIIRNPIGELRGFTFDKIRGYRGECTAEIGLKEGREAEIETDESGRVTHVRLLA